MKIFTKREYCVSKYFILVLCLSISVFISSCGRVGEGEEKNQVVFLTRATPDQLAVWKRAVSAFMDENPEIKVKLQNMDYNSYWSKLQTMIAGGTPPDIVFMESYRMPAYALKGSIEDLAPYLAKSEILDPADFYDKAFDLYKYGKKIYGIPNDIAVFCIFYNKDLFENYEVEFPEGNWTWQDFVEKAKKLTVDVNRDGSNDIYGFIYGYPFVWIWQNKAALTDNFFNPRKVTTDSDNFVEALQFLADLRFKHRVVPGVSAMQAFNPGQFFTNGKVAMIVDGHWMVPYFKDNANFNWDVVMLPKGKQRATLADGSCFSICKGSKNKEAAWKLIEFLAGKKGQEIIVSEGFSTPVIREIAESDIFLTPPPHNKQAFIKSIPYGKYQPRTVHLAELENMFYRLHEEVVIDKNADIRGLCKKYSKEMQEILDQGKEVQ